jgi:glycosyltransferase involved in cell wall biosynthesis
MKISVIVPVYNEEGSVDELTDRIDNALSALNKEYELIFIDDGSTDGTIDKLNALAKKHPPVRVVQCRKNFGKSTALDIGFKQAEGDVVITMDGDLQDDPSEIGNMLAALERGFDVVSGWKKIRHDPLDKTLPSRLFNAVTAKISGVPIHDFNCGFKAYRAEVTKSLNIYGDMHRYIPALAAWKGFRVTEIPVQHHARTTGTSKFGAERYMRGLLDFLTIAFITKYHNRPMHFFGVIGLIFSVLGLGTGGYLAILWCSREFFAADVGIIGTRPLLPFSMLTTIMGLLFFSTGLLAEMMIHLTRQNQIEKHLIKTSDERDTTNSDPERIG